MASIAGLSRTSSIRSDFVDLALTSQSVLWCRGTESAREFQAVVVISVIASDPREHPPGQRQDDLRATGRPQSQPSPRLRGARRCFFRGTWFVKISRVFCDGIFLSF